MAKREAKKVHINPNNGASRPETRKDLITMMLQHNKSIDDMCARLDVMRSQIDQAIKDREHFNLTAHEIDSMLAISGIFFRGNKVLSATLTPKDQEDA